MIGRGLISVQNVLGPGRGTETFTAPNGEVYVVHTRYTNGVKNGSGRVMLPGGSTLTLQW